MTLVTHPAKYSNTILAKIADQLAGVRGKVLDPFAGTGRIHLLARRDLQTVGIELEPEWASMHPRTIVGDARRLPFPAEAFDAIAVSCCYGNRLADSYDGRDGTKRYTYRLALGRELSEGNTGGMQWGEEYRRVHRRAWGEAVQTLRPGGLFVLNISDHIRAGKRVHVADFHIGFLMSLGLVYERGDTVATRRNRNGANAEARIEGEQVVSLRKLGG